MEKSPDAFRTISEVAEALGTPAHVLRFWETRFTQIRPVKRAGGRRYYRPSDVALLAGIRRLLHDEGLTIRGVQKILREQGVRYVTGLEADRPDEPDAFDILTQQLEPPAPVDTVVEFPATPKAMPPPPAFAPEHPDLFSLLEGAKTDTAEPDEDAPLDAVDDTPVWLPTLLRGLPDGAFANRQAGLVALHGRLVALHEAMTQPRRHGRG